MTARGARRLGGADRAKGVRLVVADLDGTLLHGAPTFEGRFLTERSAETVRRLHEAGYLFALSTARPVSTGLEFARCLPVDACVYLNGALIDLDPSRSDYAMLTSPDLPDDGHLLKVGFPSSRACEVCLSLLDAMPGLKLGIVMDDVRYTNFDVSVYWKTQAWRPTDFSDVPEGVADKIIVFPEEDGWERLGALIPDDFDVAISEGTMWMLMHPRANKRDSLLTVCDRLGVDPSEAVAFGDDLIDIAMLETCGTGVAVANAHPDVLAVADETCPSNDEDGVARWIEERLLGE